MEQPLLTIAIPTYNRSGYLSKCLRSIVSQLQADIADKIELIVFDNHSSDCTAKVIADYINMGVSIKYFKNSSNLGLDRNIANCYLNSNGKYLWVFGDDDFILPGCLGKIINLLEVEDWGVVYLRSDWYTSNYEVKAEFNRDLKFSVYDNPVAFLENVNYWVTFITGNIVNRLFKTDEPNIKAYYGTSLVHLSWILPCMFTGANNVIIEDALIACKADNTGGYKLFEVFAVNFNWIIDKLIKKKLIAKSAKKIINKHLLRSFFPMFISEKGKKFERDEPLKIMIPLYWQYWLFWRKLFPMLVKYQYKKNEDA